MFMTKRYFLLLLMIIIVAASCKKERRDMLARVWQEVSTQNPQFDEVMRSQQQFIDTVGSHTTPAENLAAYGSSNIDSFRRSMQINIDSFRKMQQENIKKTRFDFRENGVVYIHSEIGVDS